MKRIFIGFAIIMTLFSFECFTPTVYLCNGSKSVAYHKSSYCRGLNRCSTEITAVSEEIAIQMGRRKCKIEY
jgi:hypothetical protein